MVNSMERLLEEYVKENTNYTVDWILLFEIYKYCKNEHWKIKIKPSKAC